MDFLRCKLSVVFLGTLPLACSPSDREKEQLVKPRATPPAAVALPAAPGPRRKHLTWTGCDISKKAYMVAAVAEYEKQTGVQVIVTGGGATRGIRSTAGGISDLGGSCRHTLPGRSAEEAGALLTVVGWGALVFFTHPGNAVDGITADQARGILSGSIANWREVGGPEQTIVPVFRRQTVSGKLSGVGFMTRLLLFEDPDVDYTANAIFCVSSAPVEELVASTRFSFAVTGVSSARKRRVKILALDGVEPSKANIASGAYSLFRPLYLVTKGEPSGAAADFVDWILGAEGQAVISRAGAINLKEGAGLVGKFEHWPDKGRVRNL